MQDKILLNFFDIAVEVKTTNEQIIEQLKVDFSHFIVKELNSDHKKFDLEIEKKSYQEFLPQNRVATKQTENSIYYDVGEIRYNDYYGKALSIFDYDSETAVIYYTDEKFIKELTYLIILSRTTKLMDQMGLHKVHACGINLNNKNLIFMMPSKGGKTSLFCEFIQDEKINIISDDTPVIDQKGNVHAFPLRVGFDSRKKLQDYFPYVEEDKLVEFDREHFSKKYLVSLSQLKNQVTTSKETVLVHGFRSTYSRPQIKKIGKFKMLKNLMEHMVVGIGLPMVVEYFLRNNLKDHIVNFSIFLSRFKSAFMLVKKNPCFEIYCSSDLKLNKEALLALLDER